MSQKIDDVLEILTAIRKGYRADRHGSVRDARIRSKHDIANQRGVTYQTIGDAYLRRLKLDINGTAAFDRATEEWLSERSDQLKRILQKHALDQGDQSRIKMFFS